MHRSIALIVLCILPLGCATHTSLQHTPAAIADAGLNRAPIARPTKGDPAAEGYQANVCHVGPVIVAGQPTQATLERLAKEGCTLVVNVRTPQEMADRQRVPFDEAAVLKNLNIEYVFIPLGGPNKEFPYTPEATDQFAAALARHNSGPVLLHCQVGWRATNLWTAYLIRTRDVPPAEAIADGQQMVMDTPPFETLAGIRPEYVPAPKQE
ncbi:MAG: hypothetical protein JSS51_15330 [Planctomycetes bacterium]|nr:hypothetical protein [Planctomycetota bacterium]